MSITFDILGAPGKDNAAVVRVNTGQRSYRLLFDCGEMCLATVGLGEIQSIDHVLFSHLHMDHVGGFDSFFRAVFNRDERPNLIWGPPDTARLMGYRMAAYQWNFAFRMSAVWTINDIHPDHIDRWDYLAREAFGQPHVAGSVPSDGVIIANPDFTVTALAMDHLTPSMAYILREQPRVNVDTDRMAALGLPPGPWLRVLKGHVPDPGPEIEIAGHIYDLAALRDELLTLSPGASFAYLTDFLMDEPAIARLRPLVAGCQTVVCECSYTNADRELAERYHHMYPAAVAAMAHQCAIDNLILFHVSDRYRPAVWQEILAETRAGFSKTTFPDHWQIRS